MGKRKPSKATAHVPDVEGIGEPAPKPKRGPLFSPEVIETMTCIGLGIAEGFARSPHGKRLIARFFMGGGSASPGPGGSSASMVEDFLKKMGSKEDES